MKPIAKKIAIFTATTLLSALPAFAGDMGWSGTDQGTSGNGVQKNECLLVAHNCNGTIYDLPQRIEKLQREINKGTAVYTPAELNYLKRELKEDTDMFSNMTEGGA
ncbi:hypothetical protein L4X63_02785 [Geomonas sp. Red32]|uniref:hypothetical protein n=1 Tax=Geomonas sp. Red32 TaxID=2912856 RepID=UPI00202CFA4A|nr:hypothetical protein [Geomonas sp. Red32]MCM0080507.1 hypothetical protein [Geomonas sp. Red32]